MDHHSDSQPGRMYLLFGGVIHDIFEIETIAKDGQQWNVEPVHLIQVITGYITYQQVSIKTVGNFENTSTLGQDLGLGVQSLLACRKMSLDLDEYDADGV